MTRFACVLAVTSALLAPRTARATVGGPTVVEVLGYAPIDGKIYWRVHSESGAEEVPQVWFTRVDGPHAGRPFLVRSWLRPRAGEAEDWDALVARVEARVERLRRNLVALDAVDDRWRVRVDDVRRSVWEDSEYGPRPRLDLACTVYDGQREARAELVSYEDEHVAIASTHFVGPFGPGVVVLRAVGIPWEGGYTVDTVVPVL